MQIIRIGTRQSKLAMVQTQIVVDGIKEYHSDIEIEIVKIETSGDWKSSDGETRLSAADGGKGLFAKEIESAILSGRIDCGVHSLKDMESFLPDGLSLNIMLPRTSSRDAFLSDKYETIDDLPQGATIGTSSVRRQAFLLYYRPDLNIVPLRGNVPTRIAKLKDPEYKLDGIILAVAGLRRLDLMEEISSTLEMDMMLPAAGQGTVAIEMQHDNQEVYNILAPLHCQATYFCSLAERSALQMLDGSCRTPIGAHALLDSNNVMSLKLSVASRDGKIMFREENDMAVNTAEEASHLGQDLARTIKDQLPSGFLDLVE